MNEVGIDLAQIVAVIHGVEKLFAHAHECRGAAGREIKPAEQFKAARLAGVMKFGGVVGGRRLAPLRDGGIDTGAIVAESPRQSFKEGNPGTDGQVVVAREDFARQRHAGGLASSRKQRLAEIDQTGRALMRRLAAFAQDQGAAAVGDALQHLAKKRGVHRSSHPLGQSLANDRQPR